MFLLLLFSPWVVLYSFWPHGLYPVRLLSPWGSLGKNIGVGCHFLLQGIILHQWLNPPLLQLQEDSFTETPGNTNKKLLKKEIKQFHHNSIKNKKILRNTFYYQGGKRGVCWNWKLLMKEIEDINKREDILLPWIRRIKRYYCYVLKRNSCLILHATA